MNFVVLWVDRLHSFKVHVLWFGQQDLIFKPVNQWPNVLFYFKFWENLEQFLTFWTWPNQLISDHVTSVQIWQKKKKKPKFNSTQTEVFWLRLQTRLKPTNVHPNGASLFTSVFSVHKSCLEWGFMWCNKTNSNMKVKINCCSIWL